MGINFFGGDKKIYLVFPVAGLHSSPRIRKGSTGNSRFCQPGLGVITVVSSDASHPDVRGVTPSNKKTPPQKTESRLMLSGGFRFLGNTLVRERLVKTQPLTHHVQRHHPRRPSHQRSESQPPPLEQQRNVVLALHGLPDPFHKRAHPSLLRHQVSHDRP